MALPPYNEDGLLPAGVHRASRGEVRERFGNRGPQRARVTQDLERILDLALAEAQVERIILFGSYVTEKEVPGDVDLLLIVSAGFQRDVATGAAQVLFDHQRAERELGAHIFWIRSSLGGELIARLIASYSIDRNGRSQGVVEVDRE